MNAVLLGNTISLISAAIMVGNGFLKKKKHILLTQCVQFTLSGAANWILGGITGAISAPISIARNLYCLKFKFAKVEKAVFIAIQVIASVLLNKAGWLGWLPIVSACFYTWFMDVKDEKLLKSIIIVAQALWVAYDLSLKNYVSFAFDIFTIMSNVIGIAILCKQK